MNRREAVKTTAVLLGGALFLSGSFVAACAREQTATPDDKALTPDDQALIEEIADTLLPTTPSSPGAKAAGAGAAINLLLTDCYEPEQQERVVKGLLEFQRTCGEACGDDFALLPRADRERLVHDVDAEARLAGEDHYFGLIRELALRAYFSSEIGMTKARRYILVPGKWVGCMPLTPGQPAWA
ncbi:MAG: gluconate 2-dehydrogenase subunit 3 family protein [bacterium]